MCALSLFLLSSCGVVGGSSPERSVKEFLDQIIEINQEQKEYMKLVRAGRNVDQEAWVKLNTDAMEKYTKLHCYQGVPAVEIETGAPQRFLSNIILSLAELENYTVESVMLSEDNESATVVVSHNIGNDINFMLKRVDGRWFLEILG